MNVLSRKAKNSYQWHGIPMIKTKLAQIREKIHAHKLSGSDELIPEPEKVL